MKNSLGNSLILTIFGESHGEIIGAVTRWSVSWSSSR